MTRMRTKANTLRRKSFSTKSGLRGTQAQSMTEPLTLRTLLPQLTKNERLFFDKLDKELEKIEGFYLDREKEMAQRTEALKVQLEELEEHKAVFKAATNARATWFSPNILANKLRFTRDQKQSSFASPRNSKISKSRDDSDRDHDNHNFDPETYHTARKALNKALVEHYRLLEILTNYRILNITGFRKALKKFEKTTRVCELFSLYIFSYSSLLRFRCNMCTFKRR
ncbi:SPX domain-containing protein [Flagelloscypha sp. PMI_526]|nr:SPX domain-containing protein [Flagelloscypha sp. PMI_526]